MLKRQRQLEFTSPGEVQPQKMTASESEQPRDVSVGIFIALTRRLWPQRKQWRIATSVHAKGSPSFLADQKKSASGGFQEGKDSTSTLGERAASASTLTLSTSLTTLVSARNVAASASPVPLPASAVTNLSRSTKRYMKQKKKGKWQVNQSEKPSIL